MSTRYEHVEYCGKVPPDGVRTRIGQCCVLQAGHVSTRHRSLDLEWTELEQEPEAKEEL